MKITKEVVALVAILVGGGEQRLAVNRIESKVDAVIARVERLEREQGVTASLGRLGSTTIESTGDAL